MLIDEARKDRQDAVADMVSGNAWQQYARPALQLYCRQIERNVVLDTTRTLEEIRVLQAEWAVIQRILDDPVGFFSYNGEG